MEALTINIVLWLMDGTKISKTFIPTRYGLKRRTPPNFLQSKPTWTSNLAQSDKKNDTHIIRQAPGTMVLSTILQDFLVHTNGPKGPHSAAEITRKDLAIYI